MSAKKFNFSVEFSAYIVLWIIFSFVLVRNGGNIFAQDMRLLIGGFVFVTSLMMMLSQRMQSITSIFYTISMGATYIYLTNHSEYAHYISYRGLIGGIFTSLFLYSLTLSIKEEYRFVLAIVSYPLLLAASPFYALSFLGFYPFLLIAYQKNCHALRYFAYFGLFFCVALITILALHVSGYYSVFSIIEGKNYIMSFLFFSGYFIYKLFRRIESFIHLPQVASPIILTAILFLVSVYQGHHEYNIL